jgi:hypothetical protein
VVNNRKGKKMSAVDPRINKILDKVIKFFPELESMRADIDRLERSIPRELPEAERIKFVEAQSKADRIAQMWGDSAGAPRWQNGESLGNYTRRLLGKYKVHSPTWRDKNLAAVHDSVLDIAETQIYADAATAVMNPASGQPLREIITQDRTGRKISTFAGDTAECWAPFKFPTRNVKGFNVPQTGHNITEMP